MTKILKHKKSKNKNNNTNNNNKKPKQISKSNAIKIKYHLKFSKIQILTDTKNNLNYRSNQIRRKNNKISNEIKTKLITQISKLNN